MGCHANTSPAAPRGRGRRTALDTAGQAGRILVVEDYPVLAQVASFNLRRAGYRVKTARNGREARGLLGKDRFDLVVTDKQMPEMIATAEWTGSLGLVAHLVGEHFEEEGDRR